MSLTKRLKRGVYDLRFTSEVAFAHVATWTPKRTPDFIGIGTARSASTWLHSRLSKHPDVYLPKKKELHFFNERRAHTACEVSGATWKRPVHFDLDSEAHWRWYAAQFAGGEGKVCGEITPDYSTLSEPRVGEIKRHLPELKVILNIRNPIERAWSGLRFSWQRHQDDQLRGVPTDDLIRAVMHPERLLRGDYPMTIINWERHFGGQMLYLFYDDIATDPRRELGRVADFLEIDPAKLPDPEEDKRRVNDAPGENIPPEVRTVLRDHYAPQIRWLEAHFSRDLSNWLT